MQQEVQLSDLTIEKLREYFHFLGTLIFALYTQANGTVTLLGEAGNGSEFHVDTTK